MYKFLPHSINVVFYLTSSATLIKYKSVNLITCADASSYGTGKNLYTNVVYKFLWYTINKDFDYKNYANETQNCKFSTNANLLELTRIYTP